MLYFKHPKTDEVIEFSEEFANQVIIPQGNYIQVEAPVKSVEAPKVLSKTKKKATKRIK